MTNERFKEIAQEWAYEIATREPGYEWWRINYGVKTPEEADEFCQMVLKAYAPTKPTQ